MDAANSLEGRQGYRLRSLRDLWVEVSVDLDRPGPIDVVTDFDALSDAIAEIAAGGGFAIRIRSEGGPCADAALIIEDCAVELGAALAEALGPAGSGIVLRMAPAGFEAAVLGPLARALGARVETAAQGDEASGFGAAGRAIRAALRREAVLSRR